VQFLYPYIVLVHVLGAFGFALAHGTNALVAFRVRREREPHRITALLDLSSWSLGLTYGSLLVLVGAGVTSGIIGGWFGQVWIWAAIGVLVAVTVAMLAYAAPYYQRVREALGQVGRSRGPAPEPASAAELAAILDSRRPEGIAVIGGVGLALILWLMVLKPF
jgi:cytochrome bd-type quinol oxidase subunit 2